MNDIINSTLAAKFSLHSDVQLEKADRLATIVQYRLLQIYGQIKWELHNKKSNTLEKRQKIKLLLQKVITVAFDVMNNGFEDMAITSHSEASKILSKAIPAGHLSLITERKPITEAITALQKEQIKDAVFDPLTSEKINQIVKGQTAGVSWQARLAQQTSLAPPEHLASLVSTGFLQGDTPASLAAKIKPFVQGVASTARRVARNESMRIAHESRMDSYSDLGDLVIGYQIHATMDSRVRPHHAARSGTIYYKKPKANQPGLDKMPRPPLEEDGTVAHNCRCWITPVLEIQSQVEDDPAAKALFTDNKGDLIPNPAVYTTWFKNANISDQRKVVGAKRIAAVQARIGPGKQIKWADFVNPKTGKLLDASELANETEEIANKRVGSFERMIGRRLELTQKVYTYGYLPPAPPKALPSIQPLPAPLPATEPILLPTELPATTLPKYDLTNLVKVGSQMGSNEGGTYANATGQKFYVKTPKTQDHADNEILASKLYKACGIDSVEVLGGTVEGKFKTISPMIDSIGTLATKINDQTTVKELQKGFAIDCWLANWDVAGQLNDNVIIGKDGKPVRVDPGGALTYRAQGGAKGTAFGDTVPELKSLIDPNKAPQASKLFGPMTEEEKKESAKKLLLINDKQIEDMVGETITDPIKAKILSDRLKARKQFILNEYGLDDKTTKAPIIPATAIPSKLTLDLQKKWQAAGGDLEPEPDEWEAEPEPVNPFATKGEMHLIDVTRLYKKIIEEYEILMIEKDNYSGASWWLAKMALKSSEFAAVDVNSKMTTINYTYKEYIQSLVDEGLGFIDENGPDLQSIKAASENYGLNQLKKLWKAVANKIKIGDKKTFDINYILERMRLIDPAFAKVNINDKVPGFTTSYYEFAQMFFEDDYEFDTAVEIWSKDAKFTYQEIKAYWVEVTKNISIKLKDQYPIWKITKEMEGNHPELVSVGYDNEIVGGLSIDYSDYFKILYDNETGFKGQNSDKQTPTKLADYTTTSAEVIIIDQSIQWLKVTVRQILTDMIKAENLIDWPAGTVDKVWQKMYKSYAAILKSATLNNQVYCNNMTKPSSQNYGSFIEDEVTKWKFFEYTVTTENNIGMSSIQLVALIVRAWNNTPLIERPIHSGEEAGFLRRLWITLKDNVQALNNMPLSGEPKFDGVKPKLVTGFKTIKDYVLETLKQQPDYLKKPKSNNSTIPKQQFIDYYLTIAGKYEKNEENPNGIVGKMQQINNELGSLNWKSSPPEYVGGDSYFAIVVNLWNAGTGAAKSYTGDQSGKLYTSAAPLKNKSSEQQDIDSDRYGSTVNNKNYLTKFKQTPKEVEEFINPDGVTAGYFTRYVGSGYRQINADLRAKANTPLKKKKYALTTEGKAAEKFANQIKTVGSTIPAGTILYKGGWGFDVGMHTDHGFMSTSLNYNVAHNFWAGKPAATHKLYTIKVMKDIKALCVEAIVKNASNKNGQANLPGAGFVEKEFLFPTGMQFLVTGVILPDGTWEIQLYG